MNTQAGLAPPEAPDGHHPLRGSAVPRVLGELIDDPGLRRAGFHTSPDGHTVHLVQQAPRRGWRRRLAKEQEPRDRATTWLRTAMFALAVLAMAAAAVSYEAQYRLVFDTKHVEIVALIQAGIPDAGALVFASLGIAMALWRKRALRARALNLACVGVSIAMNALASSAGFKALSVWVMAPAIYALASDTLIGVIRAIAVARQRQLDPQLADDEATPLAMLGGVLLWVLRLIWAPPSTIKGFRLWVVEECPVAPGRKGLPRTGREAMQQAGGKHDQAVARRARRRGGGRRRGGRDWAALSAAVRRRYENAGVTQTAYEDGADLTAARGHAGRAS